MKADIKKRLELLEAKATIQGAEALTGGNPATVAETLEFLSAVMRGEIRDADGLIPSVANRMRAAKMLSEALQIGGSFDGLEADDPLTASLREEARRLEELRKGSTQQTTGQEARKEQNT